MLGILGAALAGPGPALSIEYRVGVTPVDPFVTIGASLDRYLSNTRTTDVRTANFGSMIPWASNDYDTNELRVYTLGAPSFPVAPAFVDLGARAHLRISGSWGLLGEAGFAYGSHRVDRFLRYLLTDPGNTNRYLGSLRVQAREQGGGGLLQFSLGARFSPDLRFLAIEPFAQILVGAGPLLGYQTEIRLLARLEENWVGAGPLAFSNLSQGDLGLAISLAEDRTLTRSITGVVVSGRLEAGLAFGLGPHLTARLELGVKGNGFLLDPWTRVEKGTRAEYALGNNVVLDPQTLQAVDYLSTTLPESRTPESVNPFLTWSFTAGWVLEQKF